ncbi:MAG TPA: endonuclease/exonuclease/phosphatase family protein [Chloroflexaceae bacterium]|nr:endonuclease/exonuclease/phosphatase family protein [Chloroflexaceae bacterium]
MDSTTLEGQTTLFERLWNPFYRRLTELSYSLRPEHPLEGLAHIPIAAGARRRYFRKGIPLDIIVWNTFKGRRGAYYDALAAHTAEADLILLQEFRHDPLLEASHQEIFTGRDADLAVSFFTRPAQGAPTGVCTVSAVRAVRRQFLLSRYFEPVTRTPKMALCTYYPFERPDCPPEDSLLVLNSHGINFRLRRPFLDQMLQFEEQLCEHRGPIILVGDFNTWEHGRVRILERVAHKVGLSHVRFPRGIKAVRGHELDRVYVRGGATARERVVVNRAASDHSMLMFQFIIA